MTTDFTKETFVTLTAKVVDLERKLDRAVDVSQRLYDWNNGTDPEGLTNAIRMADEVLRENECTTLTP